MNNTPIEQVAAAEVEASPAELPTPHFDDIAVLIAQPVEPIAPRARDWFAVIEKPWMLIAIVVIGGLLGTTAVALTLQMRSQPQIQSAAATEAQVEQPATQTEAPMGAAVATEESSVPKTRVRKVRPRTVVVSGRPVARRVGVIN